eukprot:TRINITY_DN8691_c0_g1_i1.p1 TRINITY_DN8691_c0_g1~~TRINITY_DN8691_c0_g1_i1.p1  ORF type:complete len:188 (-),score=29.46 TRINITY_DN8691_c0_g1_i1:97-660(-)
MNKQVRTKSRENVTSSPSSNNTNKSSDTVDRKNMNSLKKGVMMFVLISLISIFLNTFFPSDSSKTFARISSGVFMLLAGTGHFRAKMVILFRALIPDIFPDLIKDIVIYLSGIAEVICGALLLIPRNYGYTELGANLTILLLIAVFPANIFNAFSETSRSKMGVTQASSFIRLPIQFVFIYWVFQAI